jgi:hypothetical protein
MAFSLGRQLCECAISSKQVVGVPSMLDLGGCAIAALDSYCPVHSLI